MENKNIGVIVPHTWVHLFDAYGVIIDSKRAGMEKVERYKLVAPVQGIDTETMERAIREFEGLLNGSFDPQRKVDIINALSDPLKGEKFDYKGVFYSDALDAITAITGARDQVVIFSSKVDAQLQSDIADTIEIMPDMYEGRKTEQSEFTRICGMVASKGGRAISHTADELPELIAASKAGFVKENLVYVHRGSAPLEGIVLPEGVGRKVITLADVSYQALNR